MTDACRYVISLLWQENILPDGSHAGLIRDRFVPVDVKDQKFTDVKKDLQKTMRNANVLTQSVYLSAFDRYLLSLDGCESGTFRTAGRMVIGLGSENVLETGLTLQHTYGTPVIPGTALKGLASHYCHTVWGAKDERFQIGNDCHTTIFGMDDNSGHIIFHDAWITPDTLRDALHDDVMTPHHSDYYSGKSAPTDFDDPKPIAFLSLSGTFHVTISCDVPGDTAKKWTEKVFGMLTDALREWGIGGKTSAGYGRMFACGKTTAGNTTLPVGVNPDGQSAAATTHRVQNGPRYKRDDIVTVKRAADITNHKGITRRYFVADDGFGGYVELGIPPDIPVGGKFSLKVYGPTNEGDRRYIFSNLPNSL